MYYAYLHQAQSNATETEMVVRIDQTVLEVAASTTSASSTSEASSTSSTSLSAGTLSSSLDRRISSTPSTPRTQPSSPLSTSTLTNFTTTFFRSSLSTSSLSRTQNASQTPVYSTHTALGSTVDTVSSAQNAQTATNIINSTVSTTMSPTSTSAPASVRVPVGPSFIVLIIGVCIALLGGCWYGRHRLKQHAQLVSAIYDDGESLVEDGQAAEKYGVLVLKDLEQEFVVVEESHLIEAKERKEDLWLTVKAMLASGAKGRCISYQDSARQARRSHQRLGWRQSITADLCCYLRTCRHHPAPDAALLRRCHLHPRL
eukprot:TRINITY_DN12282_c0_g1_i7.p2 TRINITY_DN12282_c0_g1~~TRINITY_DN12282_c0_g1_i7.p2  ORF type:complete len:315 (+),score=26.51 TRINITY_DN12282_c0_g1_i7:1-945(+)